MATAISQKTLATATPAVYGKVTYNASRSGNDAVFDITVSMWINSSTAWRNNRWAAKLWVNNEAIWTNQTIKAKTSGAIGNTPYTATVKAKVKVNSGNIPIKVQFVDTGGSTSWTVNENWGTYEGTMAVVAPSAPSKPTSIVIPSSAAPDQIVEITWGAASGGSNGVTGYRFAYSKDGGTNWTYENVTGTSKKLDLNTLGFKHGDVLKAAVQSYSTVNGTNYYSDYVYSGTINTNFVAPSAPSTITIPSAIAPDKVASISWSTASGGTNGVKGYEWQWSNDGGNTWPASTQTTDVKGTVDLGKNGFKHGSKLMARVRAYTIGQDNKYYSAWKTSGTTTTNFVAPSAPQSLKVSTDMPEPIPTGIYKAGWSAPSNVGSNGVNGYRVQWLKNGANFGSEYDVSSAAASKVVSEDTIQPGDTISFKVRAYTIGQEVRYYSEYTTSGTITIVSDKFIFISQNGGTFVKYKAFISVNGGSFTEIKKEKLKVIK